MIQWRGTTIRYILLPIKSPQGAYIYSNIILVYQNLYTELCIVPQYVASII